MSMPTFRNCEGEIVKGMPYVGVRTYTDLGDLMLSPVNARLVDVEDERRLDHVVYTAPDERPTAIFFVHIRRGDRRRLIACGIPGENAKATDKLRNLFDQACFGDAYPNLSREPFMQPSEVEAGFAEAGALAVKAAEEIAAEAVILTSDSDTADGGTSCSDAMVHAPKNEEGSFQGIAMELGKLSFFIAAHLAYDAYDEAKKRWPYR